MNLHKDEYLSKLKEKAEQVEKIYDITTRHTGLIEHDMTDELARSLSARQRHIDTMYVLEEGLALLQPETEGIDKDGEIKAMYEHINGLIRKTLEMDEANLALGKQKTEEYRAEMRKNRDSRKGVGAYMAYTASSNDFDQKR